MYNRIMPYQEWLREGPDETRQPANAQGANSHSGFPLKDESEQPVTSRLDESEAFFVPKIVKASANTVEEYRYEHVFYI